MTSRLSLPLIALAFAILLGGANGCSSDPNVEGAKLYINNEQYEDALGNLNKALTENPDNGEALALKARVLLLQADQTRDNVEKLSLLNESRETLNHAQRVAPDNAELNDTKLFAWASFLNAGNAMLQDPDSEPSTFIPLFEAANSYAPDSSQGYFGLGLAHFRNDDVASAIPPLEQAWEMDPSNENTAFYLAQAYLNNNQEAEASALLEDATERFPENQELRSLLLSSTGDVGTYEAEIEANPNDAMLRYNYGTLLIEEERFDDAVEQLSRAHELEPSADAAYNLGVAHFQKAAQIEEESEGLTMDQQEEYDAIMTRRDAELEEASAAFNEARNLSDATQERTICNSLFQVYSALGQTAEAEEAAECAGIDFEGGANGNGQ